MRQILCSLGMLLLLGCPAPNELPADGGAISDAGPNDAGPMIDGGLGPVSLQFVPFTPPTRVTHDGFVSDGTRIFTAFSANVEVSSDVGRTWEKRALMSGQLALAGTDTVYVLNSQNTLWRSDDGAATFAQVAVPTGLDSNSSPLLSTTTNGDVWIYKQTNPPALYRSTDQGAHFNEITLPAGTTVLRRCTSFDGTWVASRNAVELIRYDGTQWVTLGALKNAVACVVTPAGTVIGNGFDSTVYQVRIPTGATVPEQQTIRGFSFYLRQGNDVVRYLPNGQVERSSDDGVNWVPLVTTVPNGFTINSVAATGTTLVASTTQGLAELTAGSSAWHVIEDPGLPGFLRVVDLSFARASSGRALLLEDNLERTLFVSTDGTSWSRGRTMTQGEARVIAMSPTGDRVFVAGNQGSYRIITDGGTIEARVGTLSNDIGFTETNPAQEAVWDGDATSGMIVVSTAKSDDTEGELMALDPASTFYTWRRVKPTSTTTQFAWRPGGYHALAMSPSGGTLNRRLFTSFRTWIGTNSWNTSFVVWNQAFGSQSFWQDSEPPIAFFPALSAAFSPLAGGPLAVLWNEGRLQVGTFGFREVQLGGQFSQARVVRFSNDGRLWVGGGNGLYMTSTPVTGL